MNNRMIEEVAVDSRSRLVEVDIHCSFEVV